MINTNFREWLCGQEVKTLLEALDVMKTTKDDYNSQLSGKLGLTNDWFGIILRIAQKRVKGQDMLDVSGDVAREIMMALTKEDPADQFYAGMKGIIQRVKSHLPGAPKEMENLFATTAALRVRRYAGKIAKPTTWGHDTVSMSVLDNVPGSSEIASGNIKDKGTQPDDEQNVFDEIRGEVQMELEKQAQQANDSRSQERFRLAKKVAAKALENPPELMPVDDLAALFPDVSRGYIQKMRDEIKQALCTVLANRGVHAKDCVMLKNKTKEVA